MYAMRSLGAQGVAPPHRGCRCSAAPSVSGRGASRSASASHGRGRMAVTATLVGPDPRLAAPEPLPPRRGGAGGGAMAGTSLSPPLLRGRDVEEAAMWRCIELQTAHPNGQPLPSPLRWDASLLNTAYSRCAEVTSEYAKTFYLGTQLMTPEQAKAIWAIYVWCRRTDELVDGPNASRITPKALDRWEERLEALFEGRPYDELDAALTDTVSRFPVHIQPFRDMIDGMRMDLVKSRYDTYDELYEYCYRVAGTVALMSVPVMGVDPTYKGGLEPVYRAALALGTANQLTNILRDVGEDLSTRNRVYLPTEELERFGISERDLVAGVADERWRSFMSFQIERAHALFADAEAGVNLLDAKARWPVWSALILYRQILDAIEANGYDNFSRRAYVPKWRKLASLPLAFAKASLPLPLGVGGASAGMGGSVQS